MSDLPFHQARDRLSEEDLLFVATALAKGEGEASHLLGLMADAEARDQILDTPKLRERLRSQSGCLPVSARLYFYVALRGLFREAGLASRDLADFVAESLAVFVEQRRFARPAALGVSGFGYEIDMMERLAVAGVRSEQRFALLLFNGRRYLFLLGLFPGMARRRFERGGPPARFYEARGSEAFLEASQHRLAGEFGLESVLGELGERFSEVRSSLGRLEQTWRAG